MPTIGDDPDETVLSDFQKTRCPSIRFFYSNPMTILMAASPFPRSFVLLPGL